ncbi:MAG: glycoside hydrolase family 2 TIM barrel-domain containing protein, partial [Actinomycetota bacterium]
MERLPFNDGWSVRPKVLSFLEAFEAGTEWEPVRLPHDAMISTARDPQGKPATAFFAGGAWEYRKRFVVPEEDRGKRIVIEFEGVYRDGRVRVNGAFAGHRPYGYSNFHVRLDPLLRFGEENEIHVDATARDDSRWYSGAGIFRPVSLLVGHPVHVAVDGVHVRTPEIDDELAVVEVTTEVEDDGPSEASVEVVTEILNPAGRVVARDVSSLDLPPGGGASLRQRLAVPAPERWDVDHPALYTCATTVEVDGRVVGAERTTFGIRSLSLDVQRGLRVNGRSVDLRGACVHHDNGIIGAATIGRADERRIELLKAAGFNAVRSAHHPMSTAMLDACDRVGMLVMDEAFDMWTSPKTGDDYARSFPEWWRADVAAMVRKARNHPCVVMYSIGNEIPDVDTPTGAAQGRALAEAVRELDDTRYTTNAINPMASIGAELFAALADGTLAVPEDTGVNTLLTGHWALLPTVLRQAMVDQRTEASFAAVDVAGYNYLAPRYELDHDLHPNRVIVGSETFPVEIADLWAQVRANPHVIGDFTWTGWDYLGEVGVGRVGYAEGQEGADSMAAFQGPYPWLTAYVGDIDITGHRRPVSYYREVVFGLRTEPYIAVLRPEHHGRAVAHQSPWAWSDAVSSWSWPGFEGRPVTVEVYADADEVELLVNGSPAGRAAGGPASRYRASFEVVHQPGTIEAVAYRGGTEVGRSELRSAAGPVVLDVRPDRAEIRADDTDLAFVAIELVDGAGVL